MLSNLLSQLKTFEDTARQVANIKEATEALDHSQAAFLHATNDAKTVKNLHGKIVLDPTKDPDPYGYHGIPFSTRLQYMGWT